MKKLGEICIAIILSLAAMTSAQGQEVTYIDSLAFRVSPTELADSLISYAKTFMGTPYLLGATGPDKYDCSSFVRKAYSGIGLDIPRYTWTQIKVGKEIDDVQELRRGDLVFFGKRQGVREIGHIGIVVDVDLARCNFTFIHCAVSGGVELQKFSHPYYLMRYMTARRILPED
ncbi:MAG: C40 family peptidase [Bacteroidales bacterium]|nr:C40 family peptidase [Bacteroidales bacterium]